MAKITLKGNPIQTNGNLPSPKSAAPDFILVDKDLSNRSLKDYAGKRKLFSIVPSLDTPVCELSAKKLNDAASKHPQVYILFVSADLPFAQKRICGVDKLDNIVTLSLMRSKKFAEDYGVLIQDGPLAGICARAIVVVDENNKVVYSELVPEIAHEPNYDKAIDALISK
jgi:thiol peroxidase